MRIPLPVIVLVFSVGAVVGAVKGAPWYSCIGIGAPAIMILLDTATAWIDRKRHNV